MNSFPEYFRFSGIKPELEPDFMPAIIWTDNFHKAVTASGRIQKIDLAVQRQNGSVSAFSTTVFGTPDEREFQISLRHAERLIKDLLWIRGGCRVYISDKRMSEELRRIYSPDGIRKMDYQLMTQAYDTPLEVIYTEHVPLTSESTKPQGGHWDGCRIGFDLGGTGRKASAVIDGKVVYSERLPWDPYFQKEPGWHKAQIEESLRSIAKHLPRVDAIGGSTAGIMIDGEIRLSSLFRGIDPKLFKKCVSRIFLELGEEWGIPCEVANDGEVTALAGAMTLKCNGLLGISMGTSTAGGYVTDQGRITDWLNELAFVPVDYHPGAAVDEWSGDSGCGVQYFSQQGALRLSERAGFKYESGSNQAENFSKLRDATESGDLRAQKVFESIGVCLGYTLAWWSRYYTLHKVLVLGGVAGGACGDLIRTSAEKVLSQEFPALGITFGLLDENMIGNGQSVAAASLPALK